MSEIKQISLFVENRPGRTAKVAKTLSDAGVNIRALTIAEAGDFGVPDRLFQKMVGHFGGKGEIPANGLADPFAIKGSGQIVNDVVGDGPVVFVAAVNGGDILVAPFQDRLE